MLAACTRRCRCALVPIAFALASVSVGCVSMTPVGPLSIDELPEVSPRGTAWVHDVDISEANVMFEESRTDELSRNIRDYLLAAQYFDDVQAAPGDYGSDDWVLRFAFQQLDVVRKPDPKYFPLALLTATIYIFANGDIYNDVSEIRGTLSIEDAHGKRISAVEESVSMLKKVGLYNAEYAAPDMTTALTQAVRSLMDKALSGAETQDGS